MNDEEKYFWLGFLIGVLSTWAGILIGLNVGGLLR